MSTRWPTSSVATPPTFTASTWRPWPDWVAVGDGEPFQSLLSRVGAPIRDVVTPYVTVASADAIRHFARAYGDDNPLYSDPAYARAAPFGALFAPPLFPLATGTPTWTPDVDA